jgi:uncharacterized protein YkwD
MTRFAAALVSVSVALFFVPKCLAGPACARRYWKDDSCVSKCAQGWGFPGAIMGTDPWGPVMKPMADPSDMAATLSRACGSPTPDLGHQSTSQLPTGTQQSQTKFQSSALPTGAAVDHSTLSLPNSVFSSSSVVISTSTTRFPVVVPTTFSAANQPQSKAPSTTAPAAPSSAVIHQSQQPSSTQAPQNPISGSDIDAYLSSHNSVRAQHGAAPLTWSDQLAGKAQQWANNCVNHHSGGTLGPYGENLAAGTGSNFGISEAVKLWTNEASSYNPNNPQASHFTQVVWKATTQLGCASAECNGIFDPSFGLAKFVVCEYSPPGNVEGQYAQNVQA